VIEMEFSDSCGISEKDETPQGKGMMVKNTTSCGTFCKPLPVCLRRLGARPRKASAWNGNHMMKYH